MPPLVPCFNAGDAVLAGTSGVRAYVSVDLNGNVEIPGGTATVAIPAGTVTSATVIKAGPGRLCRVTVVNAGTSQLNFYDNASAATGVIIGIIPAGAIGNFKFELPANNGITAGVVSGTPAATISYL